MVVVVVLVVVVGLYENNDLACVRTLKNVCYVYFVVSLIVVWSAFALVTTALALVGRSVGKVLCSDGYTLRSWGLVNVRT